MVAYYDNEGNLTATNDFSDAQGRCFINGKEVTEDEYLKWERDHSPSVVSDDWSPPPPSNEGRSL